MRGSFWKGAGCDLFDGWHGTRAEPAAYRDDNMLPHRPGLMVGAFFLPRQASLCD